MSTPDIVLSRVGFHAVFEKNIKEVIDLALEYGFSSVQIETGMPWFFPEKYPVEAREEIRRYAEQRHITLKVHAPGEDFSLQTLHTNIQLAVLERLKEVIDFASDLGAKLVTVHPGWASVFTLPRKGNVPIDLEYVSLHVESLKTALLELSGYSQGRVLLCVENSPFTAAVMGVLSEMLREDRVSLAWDLAKMYRADGTTIGEVEDFFLKHLDKVRECHLHDRTSEYGHQIIGEGYVDFKHYLSLLSDYDAEYTIEVRPVENALRSFRALRKILSGDGR